MIVLVKNNVCFVILAPDEFEKAVRGQRAVLTSRGIDQDEMR